MAAPRLTFFCELDTGPLQALFDETSTLADLQALNARLSLGILEFSPERAALVRRLNQAGIPVAAWLLLPKEQGYWLNLDNVNHAAALYDQFQGWTAEHGLQWDGVGLDIEPDIRDINAFANHEWSVLPRMFQKMLKRGSLKVARITYQALVERIQADGYFVESYQLPYLIDERKARSTILQRTTGLVNIRVDREVLMLYSSFLRPNGAGMIASYAPEAQGIGLGSSGGGVEISFDGSGPLSWDELARDLRLAWHWCDHLYVFSLEGCVAQGFMPQLKKFAWDYPILLPEQSLNRVEAWRTGLRSGLWVAKNLIFMIAGVTALVVGWKVAQRLYRRRHALKSVSD